MPNCIYPRYAPGTGFWRSSFRGPDLFLLSVLLFNPESDSEIFIIIVRLNDIVEILVHLLPFMRRPFTSPRPKDTPPAKRRDENDVSVRSSLPTPLRAPMTFPFLLPSVPTYPHSFCCCYSCCAGSFRPGVREMRRGPVRSGLAISACFSGCLPGPPRGRVPRMLSFHTFCLNGGPSLILARSLGGSWR